MGLVTEVDTTEAFAPVHAIRVGFWLIFSLLVAGSLAIFLLMRLARRLQQTASRAELKARQLGQYALDEKIGSGAFGTVYRAHHALIRRPVAVKLLNSTQADERLIARFEREVQLNCKLTHPNTIAIYDYGRTPEGVFYYAMEYLDGLTLYDLVNNHGRQPEGRVIHILRQICASLAEAHAQGLVHRDIKPANIFLTQRGGVPDFVKVLDFGLVKAIHTEGDTEITAPNVTPGTPMYMSPEAISHPENVDGRSDLYSLGVVGYFLLTGESLFSGANVAEVLLHQVKTQPERPSVRMREAVSSDFESVLMQCLAKRADKRPASARALEEALGNCKAANSWLREQAETWWQQHHHLTPEGTMVMKQAN
jgi:serine/threonine protein kinase